MALQLQFHEDYFHELQVTFKLHKFTQALWAGVPTIKTWKILSAYTTKEFSPCQNEISTGPSPIPRPRILPRLFFPDFLYFSFLIQVLIFFVSVCR